MKGPTRWPPSRVGTIERPYLVLEPYLLAATCAVRGLR